MNIAKTALESITLSIVGEISDLSDNPRYKAVYFTLADEGAALPCLMWRSSFDRLGLELKSGMQIEVKGRFSLYSAKGRMQFDVKQLTLAGEGQLRAQVAALAAKLKAQGLMDASRKVPLPVMPESIALVTSPRGKAVHDVLRTLRRRYPLARVLLFGVGVEGKDAAQGLVGALEAADASEAEVVLLVRGGGSYEDLMPFNDEKLALAITRMKTPVVTGIGHEPDTSIADMVASLRASTPTAAAESVAPESKELLLQLAAEGRALGSAMQRHLEHARHDVSILEHASALLKGSALIAERRLELEQTSERLDAAIPVGLQAAATMLQDAQSRLNTTQMNLRDQQKHYLQQVTLTLAHKGRILTTPFAGTLATAAASLESLSPLAVLARGYAISYDKQGGILRSIDKVEEGDQIKIRLADGSLTAQVESKEDQ